MSTHDPAQTPIPLRICGDRYSTLTPEEKRFLAEIAAQRNAARAAKQPPKERPASKAA
jgi:hypothetical protein